MSVLQQAGEGHMSTWQRAGDKDMSVWQQKWLFLRKQGFQVMQNGVNRINGRAKSDQNKFWGKICENQDSMQHKCSYWVGGYSCV